MLGLRRVLKGPTRIAHADPARRAGGTAQIVVENLDPRLVVALAVWVERSGAIAGSVPSGASWSLYSATRNARGDLRLLGVVPGFDDRPLLSGEERADGLVPQGDSAEVSSATGLVVAVHQDDVFETVVGMNQELWFAAWVYPGDAIAEKETIEYADTFRALIERVTISVPDSMPIRQSSG